MTTVTTTPATTSRVDSLDALRGVLACGVMMFHLLGFRYEVHLLAVGSYAVYTFFVLSGFAMAWVTFDKAPNAFPVRDFAAARVARILPLWWLVVLATLASRYPDLPGLSVVVRNLTLTSALVPTPDIALGGWSIEIEVVFYLLFPVMVTMVRGTRALTAFFVVALALRFVHLLDVWPAGAVEPRNYFTIPTFLAFFVGGMLIAEVRRHRAPARSWWPAAIGVALLAATFLSSWRHRGDVHGFHDRTLMTGPWAIVLTLTCVGAVAAFSFLPNPTSGWGRTIAETLGAISFGAYLLHPLVYTVLHRLEGTLGLGDEAVIALTVLGTVVGAWCSHRFFEMPARRFIRRRLASPAATA